MTKWSMTKWSGREDGSGHDDVDDDDDIFFLWRVCISLAAVHAVASTTCTIFAVISVP